LSSHPATCTLAYWHQPLFTSGQQGADTGMRTFWQDLYNAGADVVLNGHDHDYERFAPQDPNGKLDTTRGIREFVVGTGGRNLQSLSSTIQPNSEVRNASTFGVLKLTLGSSGYSWQFMPVGGSGFTDSGSGSCH
jgi:acid phosphatase type 7